MVKDVIYHGNKTGRPGSVARKGVYMGINGENETANKVGQFLTGILVIGIIGLWLAAAILGPLAIIKYCWGYLF